MQPAAQLRHLEAVPLFICLAQPQVLAIFHPFVCIVWPPSVSGDFAEACASAFARGNERGQGLLHAGRLVGSLVEKFDIEPFSDFSAK